MNPVIVIPARIGSTRLPHKPLALINREPMIVHVWRQACAADVAPVVVACDHPDIAEAVEKAGGKAVLTRPDHPTGSDRLYEAVQIVDPQEHYTHVINVQGDLPLFAHQVLHRVLEPFQEKSVDLSTFIQPLRPEVHPPHSVKVRVEKSDDKGWVKCLDFSRKGINANYIHIGIYAFSRKALGIFANTDQTEHERSESLEQLRALDHGMTIAGVLLGQEEFVSVDTLQDLKYACERLAPLGVSL